MQNEVCITKIVVYKVDHKEQCGLKVCKTYTLITDVKNFVSGKTQF